MWEQALCRYSNSARLAIRGLTTTLFFFLSRGHAVRAFLPQCFSRYPEKSDNLVELRELESMHLLEFDVDRGAEKYIELNTRIVAMAQRDGACIVAKNQMRHLTGERGRFAAIVEER